MNVLRRRSKKAKKLMLMELIMTLKRELKMLTMTKTSVLSQSIENDWMRVFLMIFITLQLYCKM